MPNAIYIFDASSLILLWDDYPVENRYLRGLWLEWFAGKANDNTFLISAVAYQETTDEFDFFDAWLKENSINLNVLPEMPSDDDVVDSIEKRLGIDQNGYHRDGVNYNDLLIVAVAKRIGVILVSNEAEQEKLPVNQRRYRIPAVCRLPDVNVPCIKLAELLRREPK